MEGVLLEVRGREAGHSVLSPRLGLCQAVEVVRLYLSRARRRSCLLFYAAHREELYHDKGVGDPYAQQEKDDRGNHGERRPR
jgi:hypothetical protein